MATMVGYIISNQHAYLEFGRASSLSRDDILYLLDLGPRITTQASKSMAHCFFSKLNPNTSSRSELEPPKKVSTLLPEGPVVSSSITTSPSAVILLFGMIVSK
jgi:hypothetical protein